VESSRKRDDYIDKIKEAQEDCVYLFDALKVCKGDYIRVFMGRLQTIGKVLALSKSGVLMDNGGKLVLVRIAKITLVEKLGSEEQ